MITVELKTHLACRDGELAMSRYVELDALPGIGTRLSVDDAAWGVTRVYLAGNNYDGHWIVEADPPDDLACGGGMDECAEAWAQDGWTIDDQLEP